LQLVLLAGDGSNVGKTALGERLVAELSSRGLRVAVVKHVHHGVDYRVKDTGRYLSAGAGRVVAVGPGSWMLVSPGRLGFWEAVELAAEGGVDVVLVEGFRDHVSVVLSAGGCVAYLGSQCPGAAGDGRLVCAPRLGVEEALPRLLGLLSLGACRLRSKG